MKKINEGKFWIWAPTSFARMITGYGSIAVMCLFTWILSFFKKKGMNFSGKSYKFIRFMQVISARTNLFSCGCGPGNFSRDYKDIDYKKYLGPDW